MTAKAGSRGHVCIRWAGRMTSCVMTHDLAMPAECTGRSSTLLLVSWREPAGARAASRLFFFFWRGFRNPGNLCEIRPWLEWDNMSPCAFKFSLAPFFRSVQIQSESVKRKKCDSHCWHSHCCRTFFAPMSNRTAGIRTFDIRTLVSFALLTPSHRWHSHCWLRTGVVRTSVFRTLVVQAIGSASALPITHAQRGSASYNTNRIK